MQCICTEIFILEVQSVHMAVNKNALARYHVLDRCFGNPSKKYFIQDLIEACTKQLLEIDPNSSGIQRRQILSDIKFMEGPEGWNIPLARHREGKKIYYRYFKKDFSIHNQPLNQSQIEQIRAAMQILSRFEGMPQFGWVHELMPKLEQNFLLVKDTPAIISFDNNQYLKGIEHLGSLFNHILYHQTLYIAYHSFKYDSAKNITLHPYYLKQYNNRWFVLRFGEEYKTLITLALDRITGIETSELKFRLNTQWNFEEYFEDIIGVTRYNEAEIDKIHLWFSPSSAPYVLSKPLHGSQKVVSRSSEGLEVSIEVIPNFELQNLILSFGERVKVLQPEHFRKTIQERLMQASAHYQTND